MFVAFTCVLRILTDVAEHSNPNFVSPTDDMMTPCTKKISAARKKHFNK